MTVPNVAENMSPEAQKFFNEVEFNITMIATNVMKTFILPIEDEMQRNTYFSIFINRLVQTAAELTSTMAPPGALELNREAFMSMAKEHFDRAVLNHKPVQSSDK